MLWKDPMFWKMLGFVAAALAGGMLADGWWKKREEAKRLRAGRKPVQPVTW
jgi:hypothetical protein